MLAAAPKESSLRNLFLGLTLADYFSLTSSKLTASPSEATPELMLISPSSSRSSPLSCSDLPDLVSVVSPFF